MAKVTLSSHHLGGLPLLVPHPLAQAGQARPRPKKSRIPRGFSTAGDPGLLTFQDLPPLSGPTPALPGATLLLPREGWLEPTPHDLDIPDSIAERHLLFLGTSGSGKTSRGIIPLALSDLLKGKSLGVLEAKGDLAGPLMEGVDRLVKEGLLAKPPSLHILSFGDRMRSLGWNPLARVKTMADAKELCLRLAHSQRLGKSETTFFRSQAISIGVDLIAGGAVQSLADLGAMVKGPLGRLEEALKRCSPTLLESLRSGGHNSQTIILEAQNIFGHYSDEDLAATTSEDEFSFNDLEQGQSIFLVRMPEGDERLFPIHGLFVDAFCSWVTEKTKSGQPLARPIRLYLDEMASALPKLDALPRTLNTFRSRGVSFVAAVQSLSQIHARYGSESESVLAGFGSILAFRPSFLDAQWLAQKSPVVASEEHLCQGSLVVESRRIQRPALSAQDIASPPRDEQLGPAATLFLADFNPVQLWLPPIWKQPLFSDWESPTRSIPERSLPLRIKPLPIPEVAKQGRVRMNAHRVEMKADYQALRRQIFGRPGPMASEWWRELESRHHQQPHVLIRYAKEMQEREMDVDDLYRAKTLCGATSFETSLAYYDYLEKRDQNENQSRRSRG